MDDTERTNSASAGGPTALSSLTLATVSFALSRGLTFEAIEEATGLDRTILTAPDMRHPEDAAPRLWRLISMEALPTEVPSLAMARAVPFMFMGGLVEGAHYAATVREALHFFVENRSFISEQLALVVHELPDSNEVGIMSEHPLDEIDGGRLAEVGTAFATRALSAILDRTVRPRRVEYRHAPWGPEDVYRTEFGAPALFNRPASQIVFDRALLDAPVKHANLELFQYVRTHYDNVRRQLDDQGTPEPLRRLRQAVLEAADAGDYRAGAVAARAGMSVRSAQRQASAHGLTLGGMIDAVRQADAKRLVEDPTISLEAVAAVVGYSDDRAFRRAFKVWTGLSPSAYRRHRRRR